MQESVPIRSNRTKLPPKGWKGTKRVRSLRPEPPTRFRRFLGRIFNYYTLAASLIIILGGFFTALYFWYEFSDQIDRRLLSAEIFTPSAGIYSAPKTLTSGEQMSRDELIKYLRSAGYIDKAIKADRSRSRFAIDGEKLIVEPGVTGTIDGRQIFPNLSIEFTKDGKSVASITDTSVGGTVRSAQLEPKQLSTIAAEGDGRRKTVNFADLPPHLVKAITVTEDRSFFEHYGVNFRGVARALWRRYDGEDDTPLSNQGGSSITQQLIKNLLLTNEPTLKRKATEAYMSVILETRLSKQEIFTLYSNQIYLGQQSGVSIYGVGEAAEVYFGKDVAQLTLPEAAFIAGIIRSPNRYNPFKNVERVEERRNQVLDSMVEAGEITAEQGVEAKKVKLQLAPPKSKKDLQGMPYFSQYVTDTLPGVVNDPEALQHLRVYTSIDPDLQRIAYETVSKRLDRLDGYFKKKEKGTLNAALVSIRPKTGEIVAMVGGRDYMANQFNRATSAMRQPGSVFKPFVYAAALNSPYDTATRIFTAATVLKDEKKVFTFDQNSYSPNNYGDHFSNQEVTLRDALVKSKNTITVDIGLQVNIGKVMNFAHRAGLPKVDKAYPSMALGTAEATPLQVATAYTAFANLGDRVDPLPITRVTAGDGSTVTMPRSEPKNVIRSDVAYIVDDILKDVVNRGTAAQVQGWGFRNVGGKAAFAGKTGTSRDGWFVGFTPELVTVVYVGFDDGSDLGMKGSDSAMPIWADFMQAALRMHPEWNGDWAMPAGIRRAEIDIRNGSLIRELDGSSTLAATPQPTATGTPTPTGELPPEWQAEEPLPPTEIFVTDVPAEFRRVEIFIAGTIPNRSIKSIDEPLYDENGQPILPEAGRSPTPTPIEGTWQDQLPTAAEPAPRDTSTRRTPGFTTLMICPMTGMRATEFCPEKQPKSFREGTEPQRSCTYHVKQE